MINSFTHYLKTTIEFGNGKRFEIKNLIEEKTQKKYYLYATLRYISSELQTILSLPSKRQAHQPSRLQRWSRTRGLQRLISAELFARRKNVTLLSLQAAEAPWI